jgi:hypothetical protein
MNKRPTPESDKAKIAFTSLFANDDAYWIPYVVGIKLENERDEARAETIRTREFMDYGFAKAQEELATVTAQRDRLADSLCSVFNLIDEDPQSAKDLAETTLQSLPPKP